MAVLLAVAFAVVLSVACIVAVAFVAPVAFAVAFLFLEKVVTTSDLNLDPREAADEADAVAVAP